MEKESNNYRKQNIFHIESKKNNSLTALFTGLTSIKVCKPCFFSLQNYTEKENSKSYF